MNEGPNHEDWERLLARTSALELLTAQLFAFALSHLPPERREDFATDLKIQFEKRLPQMKSPTFQRAFMDAPDRVLDSAVATCKGMDDASEGGGD